MSNGSLSWKKGCGIGCGVVLVLAIVVFTISGVVMMRPFRDAIDDREILDEMYGSQEAYTPAADGFIPPARLEAFLKARERIMGMCDKYGQGLEGMHGLEKYDGVDDVPKGEIMREAFKVTRSAFGMGPLMGRFFRERNAALLEAQIGLGEYTYIYALAYIDSLIVRPDSSGTGHVTRSIGPRIRQALADMLRRQLAALEAESAATDGADAAATASAAWREALTAELAALDSGDHGWPWLTGLPPVITRSLEPYRQRLGELFCPPTVHLELTRNKVFAGIGVQGD